ncbi:HAD family hydrolase [Acetilactobacillus jinshanensis]|uniref:HAD family hydrolase n=1 Tax=Acetilactobacillus jinshanensis TaxID=1720083 RepID=A0A4P6ZLT3_9LACO|nr:HAD family hydrolase [Acetilactobacillus jinshanensis]QBP18527.1 HAD family hydrolase [Acetilactobacillus jinshanensis]URL61400.1 HAD family hydrolase [uncultured bacterium]
MQYQAILFDIDGTLIDSFPPYAKVMTNVLAIHNKPISVEQLKKTFSMTLDRAFKYLRIPESLQDQFEMEYLNEKARLNLKPVLFKGISHVFKSLNQKTLPGIAIVTSGGDQEVNELLNAYPFMKKIWTAVTADTIPYHKPEPEPLLHAVNQMGINPKHALYIGDALVDMNAAKNAKMDFGIAGWGADPKVHFTQYRYCFKQPRDILKLF